MLLRAPAVLVAAAAVAGCGGGDGKVATRSSGLAPGCEVPVIGSVVRGWLAAISSGDRAGIERRLSPASDFVRLTVIELDGSRFSTADRSKALAYLVSRHEHGESLRLIRLIVAPGVDANHDTVTGATTRVAGDSGRAVAIFDGAVNCVSGSISRWRLRPSG